MFQVTSVDDDIDWGEDTSDAAVKARQEAELSGATKNIVISDDLEKSAQERVDMFYSFVKVGHSTICGFSGICSLSNSYLLNVSLSDMIFTFYPV